MDTVRKPEISGRFDADDIRKIRDYNSLRHSQMSLEEIVKETRNDAKKLIQKYNLNFSYAKMLG